MGAGAKTAYIATLLAGGFAFALSYARNGVEPITLMLYRKELKEAERISREVQKNREKAYARWKNFLEGRLDIFEGTGIEQLSPLIQRGRKIIKNRDYNATRGILSELFTVYRRHEKISRREASRKLTEPQSEEQGYGDVVFSMVSQKTYSNVLTPGQQQRLRYFIEDMEGIVFEASERAEIYGNVRRSEWYRAPFNDIQTYMLFDDITRDVRRGIAPSESSIRNYANHVLIEICRFHCFKAVVKSGI